MDVEYLPVLQIRRNVPFSLSKDDIGSGNSCCPHFLEEIVTDHFGTEIVALTYRAEADWI